MLERGSRVIRLLSVVQALFGILFVTLVVLLPRGQQLDGYVTVDERHWLVRSANFTQAIGSGAYEDTFQQGHPGVTIMWLGMLGYQFSFPGYADIAPGQFNYSADAFDLFVAEEGYHPLDLLVAGRWAVIGANLLLLIVAWWLLTSILSVLRFGDEGPTRRNPAQGFQGVGGALYKGLVTYGPDRIAELSIGVVALHPFLVAHSRLLHPDSLLWTLMFVSMLGYLAYWVGRREGQARQPVLLLVSGIAAGLAWLTKTPGVYLVLFVGLLWVVDLWGVFSTLPNSSLHVGQENRHEGTKFGRFTKEDLQEIRVTSSLLFFVPAWFRLARVRNRESADALGADALRIALIRSARGAVGWLAIALVTFFVFWPAMWVAPIETLRKMFSISRGYAAEGHDSAIFFAGEIVNGDPGWWFYPVTYLWRSTPVEWIGLGLALLFGMMMLVRGATKSSATKSSTTKSDTTKSSAVTSSEPRMGTYGLLLLAFSLGFFLFMNLGAKKFDRYLLPAYAPLTLAAVGGWSLAVLWLYKQNSSLSRGAGRFLANGLVVAQMLFMLTAYPIYLSYYNPLMGGNGAASETMFLGWGQGLAEAADYINEENPTNSPSVATWYGRGPLSYYLDGSFLSSHYYWQADYSVVYANQRQRQAPARQLMAHWDRTAPSYTARLNGIDYAQVYETEGTPLPRFVTDWNGQIRLASYTLNTGTVRPGQTVQLELYLENLAPIERNLNLLVRIVNQDGVELLRGDRWPFGSATSDWQAGELWVDRFTVEMPADLPDGPYRVELRFYDPQDLTALPAYEAESGALLGETVVLDYLETDMGDPLDGAPPCAPAQNGLLDIGGMVQLAEQAIGQDSFGPGQPWHFHLCWRAIAQPQKSYTAFAHLVGPDGQLVAQQDKPPLGGFLPMWLWYPGLTVADEFTIEVPDSLSSGNYMLMVGLYDPESGQRLPIAQNGQPVGDAYPAATIEVP